MTSRSKELTERDRYWLRHQRACDRSGLSAKAYARKHRLSIHALYQARRRLREMGALEAGATPEPGRARARPSGGFARLEVEEAPRPRYRVWLPNGARVEWEGAAGEAELARVLGAVSQLR